jgi:4-aminobutyrate--pyruvate transaminase
VLSVKNVPRSSLAIKKGCRMTTVSSAHEADIAHVVHPYSDLDAHEQLGPLLITRGEGCYVFDQDGKRYLEGMAGLWCTSLGFSEPRLIAAATRQLQTLPFYHQFGHRSHLPGIELASRLAEIAPNGLKHVLFSSSGSEANDTAIKLVWYYNNALGRPQKKKIIARRNGYHGVTVASGSLTGLAPVHAEFDLPIAGILHTDWPSYYHAALPGESEADFTARLANNLESLILHEGPETIAAFIAEPVGGASGVIVPPAGYFAAVQQILRKYDILFIVDEVICGFGRTGKLFGSETFDLKPDLMSVAKGLSSAYQPISALLVSDEVFAAMQVQSRRHGGFTHGFTYAAHPVAAAVAVETLNIYQERDIVGHVRTLSPYFFSRLQTLADHPLVHHVRGIGLMAALQLVADKQRNRPFSQPAAVSSWVQARAATHGLIVRAIGTSLALCPPLIIQAEQVDQLVDSLRRTLDDTLCHASEQRWL